MEQVNLRLSYYRNSERALPKFSEPEICGYFSLTQDRQYQDTLDQMKYISRSFLEASQKVHYDLNTQYERHNSCPDSVWDEKMDNLLKCIQCNYDQITEKCPNVVCMRGVLCALMCTPNETREGWVLLAMKYRGIIYLYLDATEKRQKFSKMTEDQRRYSSYGSKFEQFVLTDTPDEEHGNGDAPVHEGEAFYVLISRKLGNVKLLFSSETDGVVSDRVITGLESLATAKFVELKLKPQENSFQKQYSCARSRYIKWWTQSYVAGVEDIVIGVRNDDGICEKIHPIKVNGIPEQTLQIDQELWKPVDCMTFLLDFLKKVQKIMEKVDSPTDVFKFTFIPRYNETFSYERLHGKNDYTFLPPDYCTFVDNNRWQH